MTVTEIGTAQGIDQDPVGAALRAATAAIIALRTVDHRAARHLSATYDEIAHQHTGGIISDADTIHALARLTAEAGQTTSS